MLTVDIYNNVVATGMVDLPASDEYILRIKEGTKTW